MRRTSFVLLSIFLLYLLPSGLNFGGASSGSYYFNFDIAVTPVAPSTHDTTNVTVSFDTNYIYENPASFSPLSRIGNNYSIVIEIYPWPHLVPVCGYEEETYNLGNLSVGLYYFNVDVKVWSGLPEDIFRMPLDSAVYNQSFTIDTLTITVPDDYSTIQEAVDHARDDDVIFVRNGTYDEYVNVTRRLRVLGENVQGTTAIGFEIHTDKAVISGFTMNAGSYSGVAMLDSSYCDVTHNIIHSDFYPIALENSSSNYLANNRITYSVNGWGIFLMIDCNNNTIRENTISQQEVGIYILDSYNNTLEGNTLSDNYIAIHIGGSLNRIYHNNFINNSEGAVDWGVNAWDCRSEGNYWSDYQDRYPNASYDQYGVWNTSYAVDTDTVDRYPLGNLYWNIGDLNRDLKVTIHDLVLMAACFCMGWQEHMVHVDIAEPYGIINIFDVVKLAVNYGKEYTP